MMSNPNFTEKPKSFKQKMSERLSAFADRINTPFVQRVGNKLISKKHLAPSFFFPVLILMIVYAALGFWPVGDRCWLTLDAGHQYIYYFEQIRDVFYGEASLIYTFERTLGGEFLGYYAYYLASPLSWLVALFPEQYIVEAVTFILILKTGLSGLFFGYYIEKTRKTTDMYGITMFSTMYALCAYAMAYQSNTMWMDALMFLPLVSLGIERMVTDGKYKLFIITFALTIWSNYYIGYMCCFYVLLYFICFLCAHKTSDINNLGESKHVLKSFVRMGVSTVITLMMVSAIILSAYYSLTFGKSDFQTSNFDPKLRFDFLDLFAKFFLGGYDTVRPDGLPNMYSGMLMLFMLPLYFISKKVEPRHKIAYGVLCAIFITSFSINTVDLVWHGFQMPVWLNYRYSFMLTFILLTLAYRGYENIKETDSKFIFQTGVFLIFALMVIQKVVELSNYKPGGVKDPGIRDYEFIWASIIAIGIYMAVLYFVKHSTSAKKTAATALLFVVLLEAGVGAGINWGREVYEVGYGYRNDYVNFLDKYQPTIEEIKAKDPSFYRMEKNPFRRNNENLALNINGLASSTSTLNANVVKLLNNMGFSAKSHWTKYFSGNEVADSLFGIKYVVSEEGNHVSSMYEKSTSSDGLLVYKNPYALSIGFAANNKGKNLILAQNPKISPFDYLSGMMTTLSGTPSNHKMFKKCEYSITDEINCTSSYSAGKVKITRTENGKAYFEYTVTAKENGSIYMYLHSTTKNPEMKFFIDGKQVSSFFGNETERIHNLGYYEAGQSIKVMFLLESASCEYQTDCPIFAQINQNYFTQAMDYLDDGNLLVTDYSDTRIEGTISVKEEQFVFTSIPYDKYWNVYVDGEKVETFKVMDTLMGFDVAPGEHEIKMVYVSLPFYGGLAVGVVGLGLFITVMVLEKKFGFAIVPNFKKKVKVGEGNEEETEDNGENEAVSDTEITTDDNNETKEE